MTDAKASISRRYQELLRAHLKRKGPSGLNAARSLGARALAVGLRPRDLASTHQATLLRVLGSDVGLARRTLLIRRAATFFATAATPRPEPGALGVNRKVDAVRKTVSRRNAELVVSNRDLKREIELRKSAEEALRKSERHYSELLTQSDHLQQELRRLSQKILAVQEEERRRISRELHDVIAQTLTGISLRLATLKREASTNSVGLDRNIEHTQRLVVQSVDLVHRFARDLRPAVLDDLGLIPALESFVKPFEERTGIVTRLVSTQQVESLDASRKTVLFRVAQEALTNVERHARARRAVVSIRKVGGQICMTVTDNGRSFDVRRVMMSLGGRGLGLLGMRERLEMVGGEFKVRSQAGRGTTVSACIPIRSHVRSPKKSV